MSNCRLKSMHAKIGRKITAGLMPISTAEFPQGINENANPWKVGARCAGGEIGKHSRPGIGRGVRKALLRVRVSSGAYRSVNEKRQ